MKNIIILTAFLITLPAIATCPIDGITDACVAEFNPVPTVNPIPQRNPAAFNKPFKETVNTTPLSREIGPKEGLQNFGPTIQDYNYNSSCQFGICRTTGTPKSITGEGNNKF